MPSLQACASACSRSCCAPLVKNARRRFHSSGRPRDRTTAERRMLNYQTLVYVHILLMVFWLGTDIGVFIAGLQFMNAKLPLEQRRAAIGVGMIIDRYPRVCFAAMLPVGAQLAWLRGSLLISTHAMVILWLACIVWMAAVVAAMVLAGTPRAAPWQRIERVFQVAGVILIG